MRRNLSSGFSLMEVMVTMIIVGMVSGTLVLIWGNAFRGRSWAFKKGYHATAIAVAMRTIQNDLHKSSRLDMDPDSLSMVGNVGKWMRGAVGIDQDGCFPSASAAVYGDAPYWYWYCITNGVLNTQYNQTEYDVYRYVSVLANTATYPYCPRRVPLSGGVYPIFAEADSLSTSGTLYFPTMPLCGTVLSGPVQGEKIIGGLTAAAFNVNTSYPGQVAVKLEIYKPADSAGTKPMTESVNVKLKVQRGLPRS